MKHKKKIPTHPCLNCPHFSSNLPDTPKTKSIFSLELTLDEYKQITQLLKKEENESDII